ncbi:MAG: translesion error-prone DNA polymerase V autoproteolytic subunit [Candidatus Kaiserbacteria bacterium]|nr:translesion error-prone DNA polymerase V autoproteolytic subunit [Candidatus Kaiserbacteria bacterium]MCB9815926.1 translesion error-prone DNA polymerase V autoproteolytic subunit [Candidatus Nomurabacteria bacterium]
MTKPQHKVLVTSARPAVSKGSQEHDLFASRPAAGFPAPGDDLVERPLDLNDLMVEHPTATFFVRVSGDSMEGARIFDGDILVVDRSIEPKNGLIVVAAVYGELVVKRLRKLSGGMALVSEQEGYEPISIDEAEGCYIWGVVTGSARVF